MAVRQRIIWTTDEEWADIGEMAKASGMTRSRLIVETVQVLIPDRPQVPRTTTSDVPRTITPYVPRPTHDPTFRPAPKSGKR